MRGPRRRHKFASIIFCHKKSFLAVVGMMEDQRLLQQEEEDERKGDCVLGQRGLKERSAIWCLGACVIVLTAALVATVLALTVPAEASEADLFVHLRGFCAGVQDIAAEEYLARQESLRQLLSQHQLSAALFEAGSDLQYFTGVRWSRSERPFLFVLLANGSSLYVAPDFEAARANQSLLWADGVALATWQEDEDPYLPADAFVASYCAALASCPLLLGHDTRVFIATGLQHSWQLASDAPSNHDNASSPAVLRLEDEPEVVASLRRVKSAAEMAILRCASEATKASLAAVQPLIREGMSESELKGLLFSAQTSAGLSDLWALVLFGANAALPHGTADKLKLQSSMGVLLDTGGSLLGYQSDVSRTIYPLTHDIPPQELQAWNTVTSE